MRYLWKKGNGMAKVFLAFAAFLVLGFFCPLTARAYIQTQGTVTSESAVIRQQADANSNVIASIMKGDTVTINNEETDSSGTVWYKVFVDANTLGYVRGDLIQKAGDSAPISNPAASTTSTTITTTETPSTAGDPAGSTDPAGVNTDLTIGANTVVTPIQSQGASVSSDNVRVRADASTNASIVTRVRQSTAITLTGQATGDDGKLWFQVSFIADGSEVTGFIREDFVQRTEDVVILDEQPPADDTVLPEEPAGDGEEIPEEPIYNADYELQYEPDAEGEYDWYLHNNIDNKKNRLSEILDAAEGNGEAIETANAQLKRDKVIIIILAIVLVFLALTVTLLLFRLRDTYYDDFEGYDDDPEEPVRNTDRTPRTVKPVQKERPAPRPAGGQNRPSGGGQRPSGNSQNRPAGNGQNRPAGSGARPAGNGQNRPSGAGARPAGNSQGRPAGNGQNRPSGAAQRPAGSGQNRPSGAAGNGQSRPGDPQSRPAGASSGARSARQDAGWKAKNFMTEDDDLEFEFLNWDGEER